MVRPAHLAADFFDPEHPWEEHSPVSSVLRTLHTALGDRIAERTDLLIAQLTSPDAATRYDAIAMAEDLPGPLPRPVLDRLLGLLPDDWAAARVIKRGFSAWLRGRFTVAAEDTALPLDTLADHMATLRTTHGPDVWATDNPLVRSAYQEAVMILASHHDPRALPDIIRALETRVDEWRVLDAVDGYPQAADRLVPLLTDGLRRIDPHRPDAPIPVGRYLSRLAGLKDPIAIPVITDTLTWASRHQSWTVVTSALNALATFGPAAQAAHPLIHSLTNAPDDTVRAAARTALDALTDGKHPLPIDARQRLRTAPAPLSPDDRRSEQGCCALPATHGDRGRQAHRVCPQVSMDHLACTAPSVRGWTGHRALGEPGTRRTRGRPRPGASRSVRPCRCTGAGHRQCACPSSRRRSRRPPAPSPRQQRPSLRTSTQLTMINGGRTRRPHLPDRQPHELQLEYWPALSARTMPEE